MTSKHLTVTTAAAAALAVGAFVAGRMSAPAGSESTGGSASSGGMLASKSSRGGDSGPGGLSSRRERDATERGGRSKAVHGEEAIAAMEGIIRTNDPLDRTRAWLDYVNSLDPAEFQSVIASFRALGMTESRMGEYSMLLSAWAKTDPLAALQYAEANTGNRFARNTILSTWAGTDPEGAIAWAKQHHEGEGANPWMIGIIQGLASQDPARASELLKSMPFSEERGEAMAALLPNILQQGPDAARAWAESITDERLRNGAIGRIASSLAEKDPAATADWLARLPGDSGKGSMDDVLTAWTGQNKDAALAYYNAMPAGENRSNALRGIANSIAGQDPAAAAALIDSHAADANDQVYQQFVWHSFGEAPELAAQYIAKIDDTGDRDRMYGRMLDGWLQRDYNAASAWIGANNLSPEVRQRLDRRMQQLQQRQQ